LTELEKSIGRHVVIRHATGYRLTEFGKDLQPFAQRVEDAVLAFERQVMASEESSMLRSSTFGAAFNVDFP
jgi:DNA-binding transcriptional LysR family regulator